MSQFEINESPDDLNLHRPIKSDDTLLKVHTILESILKMSVQLKKKEMEKFNVGQICPKKMQI